VEVSAAAELGAIDASEDERWTTNGHEEESALEKSRSEA